MDKIAVVFGAVGLIGLIYWYFLGEKNEKTGGRNIKVAGGYSPAKVEISAGETVKLTFTRTDPTDCLEELYFPDLKIKKSLPLNERVEVNIKVDKPGEYEWHCGMNMFKGRLIVT